jgi:hypothetical protein
MDFPVRIARIIPALAFTLLLSGGTSDSAACLDDSYAGCGNCGEDGNAQCLAPPDCLDPLTCRWRWLGE